ncbi:MAG: phospholipid carrier-dependent glycosyltransferase [Chloroflexota bacterium]
MGRLPILFLTMMLALAGFYAGNKFWGKPAGWLVFVGLLFDPSIFAHGRYITTDLGGTLFIFLATLAIYNLFQTKETWPVKQIALAAGAIGLAFSAKLTSTTFVPIWIVLALLPIYTDSKIWRRVNHLALSGMGSLLVVWALFGFEFGPFLFVDESTQWLNGFSGPMPTFWSGIERIALLSSGERASFLLGQFSTDGFIHYFPVAFAVKTPLLLIAGFFTGLFLLLFTSDQWRKTLFMLVPIFIYFGLAMTSELNIGYRHLLPTLPFVYLIAAGGVPIWLKQSSPDLRRWSVACLSILLLLPTLWYHPHQLSYFNLLIGGPKNGSAVLVDSNLDWGQDLKRLKTWMDNNGIESVKLGWFGIADPSLYGIEYEPIPGDPVAQFRNLWWDVPFDRSQPEPGIYAISATSLKEMPLQILEEKTVYEYFRNLEPTDRIGYSILIYEVK